MYHCSDEGHLILLLHSMVTPLYPLHCHTPYPIPLSCPYPTPLTHSPYPLHCHIPTPLHCRAPTPLHCHAPTHPTNMHSLPHSSNTLSVPAPLSHPYPTSLSCPYPTVYCVVSFPLCCPPSVSTLLLSSTYPIPSATLISTLY